MKYLNIHIVLVILLMSLGVSAQQLTPDEAWQRACGSFSASKSLPGGNAKSLSSPKLVYTSSSNGNNHFYVFDKSSENSGFIILGADEKAHAVLGYCDHGSFNIDSIPDNMRWWLSQYDKQIETAIAQDATTTSSTSSTSSTSTTLTTSYTLTTSTSESVRQSVPALMTTTWGQGGSSGNAYNKQLPVSSWPVGCVATAAAQVMKYYNWPTQGTGNYTYDETYNNKTYTLSADFGNTTYDWQSMPTSLTSSSSAAEIESVSTLMYHAGVSVKMQYKEGISVAYISALAHALRSNFNYDPSIEYIRRCCFSDAVWEEKMYHEMLAGRPVIYGGTSTSVGHCFVIDGYEARDTTFHVNWGWEGYCDGFFRLTGSGALTPDGTGTGGGAAGASYTRDQEAVIGIRPADGGEPTNAFLCISGYTLSPTSIALADNITVTLQLPSIYNYGYDYSQFTVGMRIINTETNETFIKAIRSAEIAPASLNSTEISSIGFTSCSTTFSGLSIGTYHVVPVYQLSGCSEWHSMAELDDQILTVTAKPLASGTTGTCEWVIDTAGNLTVKPVDGVSGTMGTWVSKNSVPWYKYVTQIKTATFEGNVTPAKCTYMFYGCSALMTLNLGSFSTGTVTNMTDVFTGCSALQRVSSVSTEPSSLCSNFFYSLPTKSTCKLYVQPSSVEAYSSATGWKELSGVVGVQTGDVNLDEKVNITDAVEVVANTLGTPTQKFVKCWSDVNGDGLYTIADAFAVVNLILGETIGTAKSNR